MYIYFIKTHDVEHVWCGFSFSQNETGARSSRQEKKTDASLSFLHLMVRGLDGIDLEINAEAFPRKEKRPGCELAKKKVRKKFYI